MKHYVTGYSSAYVVLLRIKQLLHAEKLAGSIKESLPNSLSLATDMLFITGEGSARTDSIPDGIVTLSASNSEVTTKTLLLGFTGTTMSFTPTEVKDIRIFDVDGNKGLSIQVSSTTYRINLKD